ncbi:MAG: NAD-dependent epimerase/dehydratase family protein [Myxococcales bacterium]|nr:NAD-dependent epimerase/dehydratase family protein [Myxococcales bacterium]
MSGKELLVLGGTSFVGRAMATEALAAGFRVTVLNRGTQPPVQGVRALEGDRTEVDGLAALAADPTRFDLVFDTWSGDPDVVRASAALLQDRADRYVYVSSRSVYAFPPAEGADESHPLVDLDSDETHAYAVAKLGGERAAQEVFGARSAVLRAGLILGPHENVGRLNWWLYRFAQGGTVIVPGPPELTFQHVDARDLARFALQLQADGSATDVVGPPGQVTMQQLFEACQAATAGGCELRWVSPEAVEEAEVGQWTQLPIWLTPGPVHAAMHGSDVSKALSEGLRCRPLAQTVADTWAWMASLPDRSDALVDGVGLSAEAEAKLLAASVGRKEESD